MPGFDALPRQEQGGVSLAIPMCKFFSVTLSVAKGLGLGSNLTPDASPLRLDQHDISVSVDEHGLLHKKHAHGVSYLPNYLNVWRLKPNFKYRDTPNFIPVSISAGDGGARFNMF